MTDQTETDAESHSESGPTGEAVVLLAEDNPNDARLTERAFDQREAPVDLHVVGDGVEALRFLRGEGDHADAPTPDVLLLDLEMPRKDGIEVLETMQDDPDLATVPVVVLTSSEAERDVVDAYARGANAYLTKPVGYDAFREVVGELESFWLDAATLPPGERS
jgi:CheY-like chemotaxis protein